MTCIAVLWVCFGVAVFAGIFVFGSCIVCLFSVHMRPLRVCSRV